MIPTDQNITNQKPAHIPAKFWDPQTGQIRTDAMAKSYTELERKMSSSLPAPDTDENKKRVQKALGMPDTFDEYCIDCSHGLFEPDGDVNARLHAKGMSEEQVQEVYDLAAEKIVPMIAELAADFQADREVEKLITHFGGVEAWKSVSKQIFTFAKNNVSLDVLDALASSFEGVLALHRMMQSQEPGLSAQGTFGAMSGAPDEMELQAMMRDPKYWRDKDPATMKKVTEGFKTLYS